MGRISETIKSLIIANVIFFAGTYFMGEVVFRLFSLYYFESPNFYVWQPLTHMFMHGGIMHILFNMYSLLAFGSPVEYHLVSKRFLFFYFTAGLGAAFIHTGFNYYQVHTISEQILQAGWSSDDIHRILTTGEYDTNLLKSDTADQLNNFSLLYNVSALGVLVDV